MMYGDIFSTLTMAGAYTKAVQVANESDMRQRQKCHYNRPSDTRGQVQWPLFIRLKEGLIKRFRRQTVEVGIQTPAE
jgi:hypothetical protein